MAGKVNSQFQAAESQQWSIINGQKEISGEIESLYLLVRARENRLYTDEAVKQLPLISGRHPLKKEWRVRKRSFKKLSNYLAKKSNIPKASADRSRRLKILELGCGNGWLSKRMAEQGHQVYGVDINRQELEQARRVFAGVAGLHFINADILNETFHHFEFDVIVLAASVQYFPDLEKLLKRLNVLLAEGGEIHIIDSPFYKPGGVAEARERSRRYYEKIGVPEMSNYYFHHSFEKLSGRHFTINKPRRGIFSKREPFPWVIVRK